MLSVDPISSPVFLLDLKEHLVARTLDGTVNVAVSAVWGSGDDDRASVSFDQLTARVGSTGYRSARIRLGDVLRSIIPSPDPAAASGSPVRRYAISVTVTVTAGEDTDTQTASVVYGGIDGTAPSGLLYRHWLTWGPQITYTYRDAVEKLSFLSGEDVMVGLLAPVAYWVVARVYFGNASATEYALTGNIDPDSGAGYTECDCSYSRIASLAGEDADDITAYDVFFRFSTANNRTYTGIPRRFIIRERPLRALEFVFLNSLGAWDRVFSEGDTACKPEGGSTAFLNAGVEEEIGNDAVERWETRSGHLGSRRMVQLWLDFLKSGQRFLLDGDGTARRIIVESYETDLKGLALGSVSFTWHYAEKRTGRYYEDLAELEDYVPGTLDGISEEDLAEIQETLTEDPEALDAQIKKRLQAVGILMGAEELLEEMDPTIVLKTEAELEELRNSAAGLDPDKIYLGYEEDGE